MMKTLFEMESYYNQRAKEYENVYHIEDRQEDIKTLSNMLKESLERHHILEIACGTGFWTKSLSPYAKSIVAVDQSFETLEIAHSKNLESTVVQFIQDDAYDLSKINDSFNAAFAGFWWSHIPKNRYTEFLTKLHGKLQPRSKVLFFDNQYIEGNSTPISKIDSDKNSYQIRKLKDGSTHEIIKNFPTDKELNEIFLNYTKELKIHRWKYYWLLEYHIN